MRRASTTLDLVFAALADPSRRAILARLSQGPAAAGELAEPLHISRPAVSQHLKVLEDAGLVVRSRQKQWRTCTLRTAPLDEAARWLAEQRTAWQESFDALEKHLRGITEGADATDQSTRQRKGSADESATPKGGRSDD